MIGQAQHEILPRAVMSFGAALVGLNAAFLLGSALTGQWILDPNGAGIATDFVNVHAAGRLALQGQAAQAWDWEIHKQVQEAVLGTRFDGYFGWHYPPPFLFVAALLAKLPYAAGFAAWAAVTFAMFALAIRALVGAREGWLLTAACPAVLTNVLIGQNGMFTAALLGGALALLPMRPILAGLCLGLLSYKPQYGLLLPLALIAGGYWRTFLSASMTVIGLASLSLLTFGLSAWTAFLQWLPRASEAFLIDGAADFGRMQSALALVRYLGGSAALSTLVQWGVSGATALAVVALWRSRAPYRLKAAGLAAGTLLATPYLYSYDLAVLAIPIALLLRMGACERGELFALAAALGLLAAFPFVVAPTGFAATLIVAALIARRCGVFDPLRAPPAKAATGFASDPARAQGRVQPADA